jgi:sec-independent protein translocase protein TatA
MFLFGPVGPTELLIIVLIIVLLFGAKRLPDLGKSLGDGIRNFKKSVSGKDKDDDDKELPPDKGHPPAK